MFGEDTEQGIRWIKQFGKYILAAVLCILLGLTCWNTASYLTDRSKGITEQAVIESMSQAERQAMEQAEQAPYSQTYADLKTAERDETNSKGARMQDLPTDSRPTGYYPATASEKPIAESAQDWLAYAGYEVPISYFTVELSPTGQEAECRFSDWVFRYEQTEYGWCITEIYKTSSLTPQEQENLSGSYAAVKDRRGYWVCILKQ